MNPQIIISPTGERLVVLPESDYNDLIEAAEHVSDMASVEAFRRKLAAGEEECIPAEIVNRIFDGENRIRVWREYRGLSSKMLAERAGIASAFLSQIETGKREGTIETLRKIADVVSLTIDDLVA